MTSIDQQLVHMRRILIVVLGMLFMSKIQFMTITNKLINNKITKQNYQIINYTKLSVKKTTGNDTFIHLW